MASHVTRTNTLLSKMSEYQKQVARKLEVGLQLVGQVLLEESKKLVPQDTVALKDSGRVSKIGTLFQTVVVVGYGGSDFPPRFSVIDNELHAPHDYAVYVHENAFAHHDFGQYNFLRQPLTTALPQMQKALEAAMGKGYSVGMESLLDALLAGRDQ